jgi:hypothetical protein
MLRSFVVGRVSSASVSASCSWMRLSSYPGVRFVDCWPLLVFRACPLSVSSDSGKCFAIASGVRPGQDAYCLFLTAQSHIGLVGIPAEAWRYRTSSGCVFSSYTLKTASCGGGRAGRYLLGGRFTRIVSVLLLRMTGTSGIQNSLLFPGSRHPRKMAARETVMTVSCWF